MAYMGYVSFCSDSFFADMIKALPHGFSDEAKEEYGQDYLGSCGGIAWIRNKYVSCHSTSDSANITEQVMNRKISGYDGE